MERASSLGSNISGMDPVGEEQEMPGAGAGGGSWAAAMKILEDMEHRGGEPSRAEGERSASSRRVRISDELQGASSGRSRGGSRRQ